MAQDENSLDEFSGLESEDVRTWLHRWTTKKHLEAWTDAKAVRQAVLRLGPTPYTWFMHRMAEFQTWEQFATAMLHRFGESEETLMLRLHHRRQQQHESVQSYADDLQLLFAQTHIPVAFQCKIFLENLKISLQQRVVNTCPDSLAIAIEKAKFLELQDFLHSSERLKAWQESGTACKPRADPVESIGQLVKDFRGVVAKQNEAQHHRRRDKRPLICSRCGSQHHATQHCPNFERTMAGIRHLAKPCHTPTQEAQELPLYDGKKYSRGTVHLPQATKSVLHCDPDPLERRHQAVIYQSSTRQSAALETDLPEPPLYRPELHVLRRFTTSASFGDKTEQQSATAAAVQLDQQRQVPVITKLLPEDDKTEERHLTRAVMQEACPALSSLNMVSPVQYPQKAARFQEILAQERSISCEVSTAVSAPHKALALGDEKLVATLCPTDAVIRKAEAKLSPPLQQAVEPRKVDLQSTLDQNELAQSLTAAEFNSSAYPTGERDAESHKPATSVQKAERSTTAKIPATEVSSAEPERSLTVSITLCSVVIIDPAVTLAEGKKDYWSNMPGKLDTPLLEHLLVSRAPDSPVRSKLAACNTQSTHLFVLMPAWYSWRAWSECVQLARHFGRLLDGATVLDALVAHAISSFGQSHFCWDPGVLEGPAPDSSWQYPMFEGTTPGKKKLNTLKTRLAQLMHAGRFVQSQLRRVTFRRRM